MRYSLVAGALVAGVYATPLIVRDMVTEYAYVTQVVTVTAGQPAPEETSVAAVPTTNWWDGYFKTHTTEAPPPATTSVAPEPTTSAAPEPTTTSSKKTYTKPKTSAKPTTPTTSAVQAQATPASSGTPSFEDVVVMHHNIHRQNHSAPDIKWDAALASTALKIANTCQYEHNVVMDNGGYGQNIAAGAPENNISSIITDHFYNAEMGWFANFYGQATPSDMSTATFDKFGHFTQIVWKGTTKVGCAVVDCTGKGNGPNGLGLVADNVPPYFTVCNYGPPGNYLGEFNNNVAKPEGQPTQDWSYGL